MPKGDSADRLLKRLQKIQRAQGRLGDITTRIRTQADTLAELLKVAQAFVSERSASKPTSRPYTAPVRKPATSTTAPRKRARKPAPKASSAAVGRSVARPAARRRAPTKPAAS